MFAHLINRSSLLAHQLLRGWLPLTLVSFLVVGALGVVVHMLVLNASLSTWTHSFRLANATAMLVASTFNYFTNNQATFGLTRLSGRRWFAGYAVYLLITSLGLGMSLLISGAAYDALHLPMLSALCGIVAGAMWNYLMSHRFVWKLLHRGQSAPAVG